MKKIFSSLLFVLLTCSLSYKGFSQKIPCPVNIDFEMGDFTGWTGSVGGANDSGGVYPLFQTPAWWTAPYSYITTPYPGFFVDRQVITDASMPNDIYGNFPSVAPGGGAHSLRLGDSLTGYGAESVEFYIRVPVGLNTYSLNYAYAVVLNDPGSSHTLQEKPRFTVEVSDSITEVALKDGCYNQNYLAAQGLPGFFSTSSPNKGDVVYKPWTKAVLNISGAAGQTVKIKITTGDCGQSGHFGYGYFDVLDCGEFKTILTQCDQDRDGISFIAPVGYMSYDWYNNDYSQKEDTGQKVKLFPQDTQPHTYHLIMTPYPSVSQCPDTLTTVPFANILLEPTKDTICMDPDGIPMQLLSNAQGGVGGLTYQWSELYPNNSLSCTNCPNPVATSATSNFYTIRVTDTNNCYRTRVVSIGINENKLDATEDFVLCHPGYTTLNADPSGPLPITPVSCGTDNISPCSNSNVMEVRTLHTEPPLMNNSDSSYVNSPFAAQHTSSKIQYILKKDDLYFSGFRYGTLSSLGFFVADIGNATYENFTISLACTKNNGVGSNYNPTMVYSAPSVQPVEGWNDFNFSQPYNFDTAQNLIVEICFTNPDVDTPASVNILKTGGYDSYVQYTDVVGSSICNGGFPTGSSIYEGRPFTRFTFCKSSDRPFEYTWTPGLYLSDSTAKSPLAYIAKTTKYYVTSVGGSDCKIKDSVTVTVPIHDYDIYPKDTSVCYQEAFQLNALGTFSSVKWYEYDRDTKTFTVPNSLSCADCPDANKDPNPIAVPKVSGDTLSYAVEFTDKDGCNDTLYMNVEVRPLPPVKIVNNDTTIKYGTQIMLLAQGGYMYSWMPTDELSNPNVVNPVAAPTEPTMYYVYGLGENGCRAIDSVYVNIDFSANLFVPTAFTPNGDGKNDVFRISNITFQRLQEFRVFNRWGKEVFSTNDIKDGWDGSYKGQPQDMGVYQYIIKVASADGEIYTYKGDVTLVR